MAPLTVSEKVSEVVNSISNVVLDATSSVTSALNDASSSASSSSYLLAMPSEPSLSPKLSAALAQIEQQFSLDKALLDKTVKQLLWEFNKGLSEHVTPANRDTFLPMM